MSHGGGGEEGGGERWLVSYADFITLLMVLFVVLYSMGQTDVQKYKSLAESMRNAFSLGGGPEKLVDPKINTESGEMEDGRAKPIVVPGIPNSPPKSEEVAGELTSLLSQSNLDGEVSVQTNIEGVLISLSEKLIFRPGGVELPPDALPVLDTIAQMLLPIENSIRLVGHTDNSPPTDTNYANNWQLSLARASIIADYLLAAGVAPERIMVSGRGEFEPVFPNDTEAHRSLNGRVDIIIIYQVDDNVIGSDIIDITP